MTEKTPSEEVLETLERIKKLAQNNEQIDNQADIIRALAEKNGELLGLIEEQRNNIIEVTEELNQDFQLLKDKIIKDEDKEKLKKQLQEKFSLLHSEITKLKAEIKSYEALDLKVKSYNFDKLSSDLSDYKKLYEESKEKIKELLEKNKELLEKNNPINSIKEASEAVDKLNGYFTPEERKQIEADKLKLIEQQKKIEELEAKLAENEKKVLIEKEATKQADKRHKDALREINSLKTEREEFVGIIKILSQNSQLSLENLKLALSGMKKEKGKTFSPAEIEKILKNYK